MPAHRKAVRGRDDLMWELTKSAKPVGAWAAVSTLDSSGRTTFVAAAPSRRTLETINGS